MRKTRPSVIVLSVVGLALLAVAAYVVLNARSNAIEGRPTLLYFRLATWPFCREMNPIVDGIKRDYGSRINFVYVEMDDAAGKQRARDEGVMGTPTFVFLRSNGERAFMLQGVHQRVTMEQHLDTLLKK